MKMQALYCLLLALSLCACSPRTDTVEAVASDTYFSIPIENSILYLQLALTDGERSQGLMFRDTLPEDHGMLFLFENSGKQSFWMRNTKMALDIMYVTGDFEIVTIYKHTQPYSESPIPSFKKAKYVVETAAGFCDEFGIKEGNFIEFVRVPS